MSLIWKCFTRLGFTLPGTAVSFRFRSIVEAVLPVSPFALSPDSIMQPSLSSIRFFTLLNPAYRRQSFTKPLPDNLLIGAGFNVN